MCATGGGKKRRATHDYSHSTFLRGTRCHNYPRWTFTSRSPAAGRFVLLFGIVVAGIAAAAVYFTRAAILALPDVADTSIPSASAWAQKRQIELPFTDF